MFESFVMEAGGEALLFLDGETDLLGNALLGAELGGEGQKLFVFKVIF